MEFRIKESGFQEFKNEYLKFGIPAAIIFPALAVLLTYWIINVNDWKVLSLIFVFFALLLAGFYAKILKMQKKVFENYKLIVNDNEIIEEGRTLLPTIIPIQQITKIKKNSLGIYLISGTNKNNRHRRASLIMIPAQIEKTEIIEKCLNNIIPFNN